MRVNIYGIYNEDKLSSSKEILKDSGVKSGRLPLESDKDVNLVKKYLDKNEAMIALSKVPDHPKFAIEGQKPKVAPCLRAGTDLNYVYINVSDVSRFARMCSKLSRGLHDDSNISRSLSHVSDPSSIGKVKKIPNSFLVSYLDESPIIPVQYTDGLCEVFSAINTNLQDSGSNYRVGFGVYSGTQAVSSRYRLKSSDMKFEELSPITSLKVVVYTAKKKRNTDSAASSVTVLIDKTFTGKGYSLDNITKPSQIKSLFNSVQDSQVRGILLNYMSLIENIIQQKIIGNKEYNSRADFDVIYAIQIKGNLPHFICYIEPNEGGYKLASADRDSDYQITSNGLIKL